MSPSVLRHEEFAEGFIEALSEWEGMVERYLENGGSEKTAEKYRELMESFVAYFSNSEDCIKELIDLADTNFKRGLYTGREKAGTGNK